MTQHYSNPNRATDPHALPDVETFYIGTVRHYRDRLDCFRCSDWANDEDNTPHSEHVGWYWVPCFPGCIPDGEPSGPFTTEAEAVEDAQEGCDV
jgi:hypothetical protein